MTDRINPIIPGNPGIFSVPAVGLPRISDEEREQRRREREEDEREREQEHALERARAARAEAARRAREDGDDTRPHVDLTA